MKVLIAVTHLLGTGHLSRALTLARAFADTGHDAVVASGGMPAPQLDATGVTLHQLPPLRSDGTDFARLLTDDGQPADPAYLAARQADLLALLERTRPDILLTELYPFGRRSLRAEFLALLEAARVLPRRPVILASIRDILAPPAKPERAGQTGEVLGRFYDAVLVHSDPATTPLEVSWPVGERLAGMLRYTGYVASPAAAPHPDGAGRGEVLVSAGGGAVGGPVFAAAAGAAALCPDLHWRLLIGGGTVAPTAPPNVTQERPRPDFRAMLPLAAASVSLCGYNTALDLMQAGTPAVLIPFDEGREVEQTLRARSLRALPAVRVLPAATLDAATLAEAVRAVIAEGPRPPAARMDGAARSVAIATALAGARR